MIEPYLAFAIQSKTYGCTSREDIKKNLHNLIGVISLPFHLIMAVTGAAMGLFAVMAVLLGVLVFGPDRRGPE